MKTALLIIDIQNDYFPEGKMELVGSVEAAAAAARVLAAFRRQAWSVFHVQLFSSPERQGLISMPALPRCPVNRSSSNISRAVSAIPISWSN